MTETIAGVPAQVRRRVFDGLGRLKSVMEKAESGSGPVTSYQYDAADRLEKVTQGSRVREFFYSTAGWLYKAVNPESGTIEYDYTPGGRMLSRKDASGRRMCMGTVSGTTCTASLDASGRPLRKSYSDATPAVTYSYAGERLREVTNATAKVTFEYDLIDRVVSRKQEMDGVTYTHGATYRPGGLATTTYNSGRVLTYAVDAIGRVQKVSGSLGGVNREYAGVGDGPIRYTPHGALSQMKLGNGNVETWTWNHRLQAVGLTHGPMSLGYSYCAGGVSTCATNNGNTESQTIGHAGVTQSYVYL